jgi:MoaA/NifB/PqqE/SkfB family radical SAM enzyme
MNFPQNISFTVTNSCNLRCKMCGQWSEEGYIYNRIKDPGSQMKLADWKRLVDEIAPHNVSIVLIRGGEPFLFPGIIELLKYINSKGIFIAVDTNGTMIEKYISEIAGINNMHITFSVDGPEEIHDNVRGMKGSFKKIKENIALLNDLEKDREYKISKSICFTISRYNYKCLGEMPDVARDISIGAVNIVPYYYFPAEVGKKYEEELKENFDCAAFSWKGFHHDDSGIDLNIFKEEHGKYLANLGTVNNDPFMPLKLDDYLTWFTDSLSPVGPSACLNVERLIDIQPDGEANFCLDFPDYSIGNVMESSIEEIWNGKKASQFRDYRRKNALTVCYRCGAKYISIDRE